MKATYNGHLIESIRREDGLYHAAIDGQESGITSHYKRAAIKRAMRVIDDQEQTNKIVELKEIGL